MQSLTNLKTKSQESLTHLTETIKNPPSTVQLWGVVAASAVVGGVVLAAGAKSVLAVVGTLAVPPVALTVGAIGGGAIGWRLMQNRTAAATPQPVEVAPVAG